jgi:hypothetical protein
MIYLHDRYKASVIPSARDVKFAPTLGSENQEIEIHQEDEALRSDLLNTLPFIEEEEPCRQSAKNLHPIGGSHYN